jgi:tetratricopeptide (TPR) repeat protein
MAVARSSRLVVLSLSLVLLGFFLLACGSQENPKEAAKEKPLPVAASPAAPPGGATTPKKPEEYINQGKEFLKAKHYDQAIVSFSEAIKLDPQSVQAHNSRGIAYCNRGDFDQAIGDFSRTIEIDPKFGKGYNNRAVAYFMKGERDKARQDAEKAQSLGIPVNQMFFDILKQGETKAEEKGKGGAPKSQGPAPGKSEAQGKGETKKK